MGSSAGRNRSRKEKKTNVERHGCRWRKRSWSIRDIFSKVSTAQRCTPSCVYGMIYVIKCLVDSANFGGARISDYSVYDFLLWFGELLLRGNIPAFAFRVICLLLRFRFVAPRNMPTRSNFLYSRCTCRIQSCSTKLIYSHYLPRSALPLQCRRYALDIIITYLFLHFKTCNVSSKAFTRTETIIRQNLMVGKLILNRVGSYNSLLVLCTCCAIIGTKPSYKICMHCIVAPINSTCALPFKYHVDTFLSHKSVPFVLSTLVLLVVTETNESLSFFFRQ